LTLDLLIPGLFPVPTPEPRFPHLERWLARADIAREPAPGADAWLAQRFGVPAAAHAPIALLGEDEELHGSWLHADPVYARVQRDTMVLHEGSMLEVAPGEASELVAALQAFFASDGFAFRAPAPDRWYVRVPEGEVPETTALAEALGRDTFGLLPRGHGRVNWLSAITEVQMLLATHPVNLAREANGQPPVNTVWFWGGGELPPSARSPYASVFARQPYARGLARLAGQLPRDLPASLAALPADIAGPALVVADRHDEAWLHGMGGLLARYGTVRLVLPTGRDVLVATVGSSSRWRFMRRARALSTHA
jgi:hypothetical protein